jgi:putative membrane protein
MTTKSFFEEGAKAKAAKAIADIEAMTSAEIVLAVRRSSGHYLHADYLAGAATAMIALLLLLFLPQEFTVDSMAVDVLAAFAIGALLSRAVPSLRRLLSGRALLEKNVRTSARATFVDDGVARTHRRTGILVYVSLFERRVEVVADIGIAPDRLGEAYANAVGGLARSLDGGADLGSVLAALAPMGPALAKELPHHDDDVNELANEMETGA